MNQDPVKDMETETEREDIIVIVVVDGKSKIKKNKNLFIYNTSHFFILNSKKKNIYVAKSSRGLLLCVPPFTFFIPLIYFFDALNSDAEFFHFRSLNCFFLVSGLFLRFSNSFPCDPKEFRMA